jgi:hypothetical protein
VNFEKKGVRELLGNVANDEGCRNLPSHCRIAQTHASTNNECEQKLQTILHLFFPLLALSELGM